MASIAIKNVPEELYARLVQEARDSGCSVDDLALGWLTNYQSLRERGADKALEVIRAGRAKLSRVYVRDTDLLTAIDEGRP